MADRKKPFQEPLVFYAVWFGVMGLATALLHLTGAGLAWLLLGLIPLLIYVCRSGSMLHKITLEGTSRAKRVGIVLVAAVTVSVCILPMDQFPLWNGEVPGHRNQYELMAENILEGRLYFDYGDEEELLQLENPYDPEERKSSGVRYHWDHAFYDGQYYMYFGVVPVFLAFLPYRVLTGQPLTTYHATQLFAAVTVIGIFVLFHMLTKRFFPKLPYGVYLALSAAVSVMSVWYSTAEPALYCTAITAAIALETWSLYFFIRGVWVEKGENRQLLFAALGALLGALVFGCRPPIALANVVVLPMLAVFLKQHKFSWRLLGKLVLAALPYVVVGAALMVYNYVRFDDPFEFGQAYQLTVADQSQYGVTLNAETMVRIFNGLGDNFLEIGDLTVAFPYFRHGGVFMNFPLLLLVFGALRPASLRALKQKKLAGTLAFLGIAAVIITVLDVVWTPYLLERYRMDIYFLMGIACFIVVGIWLRTSSPSGRIALTASAMVLSVLALLSSGLLCLRTITVYYPEEVEKIGQLLVG